MSGNRPFVVSLRWRRSHAPNRRTSTDSETDATVAKHLFEETGGCRAHRPRPNVPDRVVNAGSAA